MRSELRSSRAAGTYRFIYLFVCVFASLFKPSRFACVGFSLTVVSVFTFLCIICICILYAASSATGIFVLFFEEGLFINGKAKAKIK